MRSTSRRAGRGFLIIVDCSSSPGGSAAQRSSMGASTPGLAELPARLRRGPCEIALEMEICKRRSQMSLVCLMQSPHRQSDVLGAVLPQGSSHRSSGPRQQRRSPSAHRGAAGGAGLASGPGVLRAGEQQEELARLPGLLRIHSLAAGHGQGPCAPGAAAGEAGREKRKECPPRGNAESCAFGEGLEARKRAAGRPRPGPSPLACGCVWH